MRLRRVRYCDVYSRMHERFEFGASEVEQPTTSLLPFRSERLLSMRMNVVSEGK